ncbi:MAG: DUF72 domain-containing protein [Gammaproteobacteria bacterium]|nr:DUF72 domain-containing protein [Gammaproteobacteria bacterium]
MVDTLKKQGNIRIGISGWRYGPWRGKFYPKGLAQRRELEFASRQVNSIEINGSFYSLQTPQSYHDWYEQTPADFVFSVKGGRFITHMKRLRDIEAPLANFFASGVLRLNEKLGPFLWQFPPNFSLDLDRFEAFFELLPPDSQWAEKLARRHDDKVKGRSWMRIDENRPLRHAVEIRHDSFNDERFIRLLRKHDIALVVADMAGKWPFMEDVTSDFIYVRLHGDKKIYVSGYTDAALDTWANKIRCWTRGKDAPDAQVVKPARKRRSRDVYVYFDNDVKVRAPADAVSLLNKLGVEIPPTPPERWEKLARRKSR